MDKTMENFKSTADIKVPKKIIDQVIGQDDAVKVIKKAALQRRHVILIGEPGTGKSLLGLGLAELLPKENLKDILAFYNPNDDNQPLIREVKAGEGRNLVMKAKIESTGMFKNQNIILFILAIFAMLAPWWVRNYYKSDIMFAAFFLGGMVFLAAFVLFMNLGQRMGARNQRGQVPKVIVDNYGKKQVPFFDATGAHAGALLGDVLHDPFQSFCPSQVVNKINKNLVEKIDLQKEIDNLFVKHNSKIMQKNENNYSAVHLPSNELFVLGETNGSVSPVEVLSSNRYEYQGEMIKLTTSKNKKLVVTPEHKIALSKNGNISYVEAKDIKQGDEVITKKEGIIIDEQDIINTYDERQQEQCRLYYQYLDVKQKNPTWGYKRIAKSMGQKIGKTRWWHSGKHIPVPIQKIEWLKKRGLLPLKIDNPKLPLIAKVLGATFGDGGIFENLNGIFLSSFELDAVKEFGTDLEQIFNLRNDENSRIIEGGEYGHSWCYQNTNRNIIRFFLAIGAPRGNKTKIELNVPKWLYLNETYLDNFYSSFLGGELGSPSQHAEKCRLTSLDVAITGEPELEKNRLEFLQDLSNYFKRKGIITTSIYKSIVKDSGNKSYRLLLSTLFDNVLKFMIEIKLSYCIYKKDRLYLAIGKWADYKKQKYYDMIGRGYGSESAMKLLKLTPNSLYLLLNHFGPKEEAAT